MWLILLATITFMITALLLLPLRVVCSWVGRHVEIRFRFLGLSYKVWSHDLLKGSNRQTSADSNRTPIGIERSLQKTRVRIQAIVDNWNVIVEAGRVGFHLLRRSRNWVHLESGEVEVVIGVSNPALTGISVGAVSTLGGLFMSRWPQMTVSCCPDFDTPSLYSRGQVVLRMRVWDLVWNLTLAGTRLPWRGLRKVKADLAFS